MSVPLSVVEPVDMVENVDDRVMRVQRDADAHTREQASKFDQYATSKSVSQSMLNMTSIQGLLVIMIRIFATSGYESDAFEIGLIVLISLSLSIQFIVFVLLVVLAKNHEQNDRLVSINTTVTSMTGLLLMISLAISILAIYTGQQSTLLPGAPGAPDTVVNTSINTQ